MAIAKNASAKGPASIYRPKDPPNVTVSLSSLGKRILEAADERTGAGKSNVVEHLLRLHGGSISAEEFAPLADESAA